MNCVSKFPLTKPGRWTSVNKDDPEFRNSFKCHTQIFLICFRKSTSIEKSTWLPIKINILFAFPCRRWPSESYYHRMNYMRDFKCEGDGCYSVTIDVDLRDLERSTGMVYEILHLLQKKILGQDLSIRDFYKLINMGKDIVDGQLERVPSLRKKYDPQFLEMQIRNLR